MNYFAANKRVSVALCTCEGAEYLPEQLASIARQSNLPSELVVCDDASTDSTVSIIENFSRKSPFTVNIHRNKERLGAAKNFSRAINLCCGDYIALCDQDDIWHPDRLQFTLKTMLSEEKARGSGFPILIHTDLTVVDSTGSVIAPSFMKRRKISHVYHNPLKKLLMQNFVTGSTLLLNRPLAESALPVPEEAIMHDWWLALVAAAIGAVVFVNFPAVSYRQHDANLVGATRFLSLTNIQRILNLKGLEEELAAAIDQATVLLKRLESLPESGAPAVLAHYLQGVKSGGIKALLAAQKNHIFKQGLLRNGIYLLLLLKKGYLNSLKHPQAIQNFEKPAHPADTS